MSPYHKGHKCLAANGRIYISKDVVFCETVFPYHTLFPNNNSHPVSPSYFPLYSNISILETPSPILVFDPVPSTPVSTSSVATGAISSPNPSSSSNSPDPESNCPSPLPRLESPSPELADRVLPSPNIIHTRSKSGIFKPKVYLTHIEPSTVKQAMSQPHWFDAMQAEFNALQANNTWTLTSLPPNRQAIGCKWVFRVKENPDGSINKYKARLVAKGFHQQLGFDFQETFSPVVKPTTIKVLLTLALTHKWDIQQIDVNVFFNGDLSEDIYMVQPPGFIAADKDLV